MARNEFPHLELHCLPSMNSQNDVAWTKHILKFCSAYHGHVTSAMDISPYKLKTNVDGMHPIPPYVYVVSVCV